MNLPDFIGIGTPKAATTWLFQCLAEHPEICMSKTKEVNYFNDDRLYALGPSWYAQQFSHRTNERICGEFTPTYLSSPEVPNLSDLKSLFDFKPATQFDLKSRDYHDYIKEYSIGFLVYDKNQLDTKIIRCKLLELIYSNDRYVIFRVKRVNP